MAFPSRIPPAMSPGVSGRNLTRHRHVIYSRSKTGFGLAALFIRQQLWGHPVPPTRNLSAMVGGGMSFYISQKLCTHLKSCGGGCAKGRRSFQASFQTFIYHNKCWASFLEQERQQEFNTRVAPLSQALCTRCREKLLFNRRALCLPAQVGVFSALQ